MTVGHDVAATRVLVVSDDVAARSLIEFALRAAGFAVEVVACAALRSTPVEHSCRLLLLDIDTCASSGISLCEQARQLSSVPMLVLINQSSEQALLQVMEAGADCYVIRPFSMRSLIARMKAMLRRASELNLNSTTRLVEVGDYRLDVEAHTLHTRKGVLQLTRLEVAATRALMQNAEQSVCASALIAEVWSAYSRGNRNMLKQIVFRLRRKLAGDAHAGAGIVTTAGGYMWQSNPSPSSHQFSAPIREVRAAK